MPFAPKSSIARSASIRRSVASVASALALAAVTLPDAEANGSTTWTGNVDTNWFEPGNWNSGVPGSPTDTHINMTPQAVIAGGGSAETAQVILGQGAGQTGRLIVEGTGSTLTMAAGARLVIGQSGSGEMTIRNGGTVRAQGPAEIAVLGGSDGTVTVRDPGSTWTIRDGLSLGFLQNVGARTATLAILNGGSVSAGDVVIGRSESTSSVRIAGANSVLSSQETLVLGGLGTGVLTIAEAGRAVVDGGTGTVAIASNSGSLGTLNIGAPEGETPVAPGLLDAATVAFGDGTGAIVFNHTDTGYTFAPAITGDGALRFLSGRTILTGDSGDFDGTTALSGGELVVNGTLGGTTTFASGSRLSGTGRVGPTVLESGATVAPGNSIGTLTVDGDLTFNSGTVYEVEVDPTGATSDRIVVNGTAFLDGTVTHIGEDGAYRPSADYVILTATNGFDGTRFDGVTSDYYFLDPSLLYGSNDVTLRLLRNNIAFAAVAETANQRAAGDGADSLSLGNDLYDALSVLSAPAARGALDQISGEIHASTQSALLEQTGQLRRSIGHRAADLGGDAVAGSNMTTAGSAEGQFTTWAQAFGNWGHAESDGNAAAMDHDQRGLLFGGDVRLGERTRLGVTAGSSRSSASVDDRASSAAGDTLHLGVYGGTAVGPWRFIAGASHSWHEIETDRSIAFAGFTDRPTASYDARTAQVFGEAAYDVSLEPVQLQPFVGLAHTRHDVSSFSESGGAAALAAESADAAATFSTIGLRAATDFAVSGMTTTLRGSLAWQHTLDDVTPSTRLAFGGGTAFNVDGTPLGRDAALIETGIDVAVSDAVTFGASYDGRFDDAGHEHGARARLSIRF